MTALVIARIVVRDPSKLQAYAQAAGPTIASHGGKVAMRGGLAKALLGNAEQHSAGVITFPDMEAVEAWFASPEYQALKDLREEACDMELLAYQAPTA